jgi:ElaB/YqjD/DUF883 family membrane-anchored ribosome-binding protein
LNSSSKSPTDVLADKVQDAKAAVTDTVNEAVDRGQAVISQASRAASDLTDKAAHQATGFIGELEAMATRNPLGALAGAVLIGVLIGAFIRRD